MAFRPWILTMSHIESLTKNHDNKFSSSHNWTIPEILQAGSILAYYHSLCGLIFGQGIIDDVDIAMCFDKTATSSSTTAHLSEINTSISK